MYTCLKGDTKSFLIIRGTVLTIRVGLCTRGIHRDRMRNTCYPGVRTKPGTGLVYVHEVYTGTE